MNEGPTAAEARTEAHGGARRIVGVRTLSLTAILAALLAAATTWAIVRPTASDLQPRAAQLVDPAGCAGQGTTYGGNNSFDQDHASFFGMGMPRALYPNVFVRKATIGDPVGKAATFHWVIPQRGLVGYGGAFPRGRGTDAASFRPLDQLAVPQDFQNPMPQLVAEFPPLVPGVYRITSVEIEFEKDRHRQVCTLKYEYEFTVK